MENCNLLLGILIISAMLYLIILNNPTKEHYSGKKNPITNSLVQSAATGATRAVMQNMVLP
jgi:hypothetical protein